VTAVKPLAVVIVTSLLVASCSGSPVEEGLFVPTWSADGAVPAAIVQGTLIQEDGCLYVEADGQRTLVVWEDGMGFEDGTLLDGSGAPIVQVREVIHGGGGYYDRERVEDLSDETVPERCVLPSEDVQDDDHYAIIYEVEAGPFE
jgi:hypothetical protein